MHKLKLFLILLFMSGPFMLKAQDNELKVGLRAGHNTVFGGFGAIALETTQTVCSDFSVSGGIQYNTIGKTALEARPAYKIPLKWGQISVESLLTYTDLSSINSFTAGAGAMLSSRHFSARLGYYYRIYGSQAGWISEPFNIYYDARVHFLKKIENWDLDLIITNCEMFELERHYQPSFITECCFYPKSKLGITLGIGCKPSGMFNLSADYYQSYLETGLCYRW